MMDALELPMALFAFCGIVAVLPVWVWFVSNHTDGLTTEATFLAQLVLPAFLMLFIASWLQPG